MINLWRSNSEMWEQGEKGMWGFPGWGSKKFGARAVVCTHVDIFKMMGRELKLPGCGSQSGVPELSSVGPAWKKTFVRI